MLLRLSRRPSIEGSTYTVATDAGLASPVSKLTRLQTIAQVFSFDRSHAEDVNPNAGNCNRRDYGRSAQLFGFNRSPAAVASGFPDRPTLKM
jgi:hypothetical protein